MLFSKQKSLNCLCLTHAPFPPRPARFLMAGIATSWSHDRRTGSAIILSTSSCDGAKSRSGTGIKGSSMRSFHTSWICLPILWGLSEKERCCNCLISQLTFSVRCIRNGPNMCSADNADTTLIVTVSTDFAALCLSSELVSAGFAVLSASLSVVSLVSFASLSVSRFCNTAVFAFRDWELLEAPMAWAEAANRVNDMMWWVPGKDLTPGKTAYLSLRILPHIGRRSRPICNGFCGSCYIKFKKCWNVEILYVISYIAYGLRLWHAMYFL